MPNFHIPLPEPIHARLRAAAQAAGRPSTDLAREWVRDGLDRFERDEVEREIREFAEQWAGTELDLDPALEAAGIDAISGGER